MVAVVSGVCLPKAIPEQREDRRRPLIPEQGRVVGPAVEFGDPGLVRGRGLLNLGGFARIFLRRKNTAGKVDCPQNDQEGSYAFHLRPLVEESSCRFDHPGERTDL